MQRYKTFSEVRRGLDKNNAVAWFEPHDGILFNRFKISDYLTTLTSFKLFSLGIIKAALLLLSLTHNFLAILDEDTVLRSVCLASTQVVKIGFHLSVFCFQLVNACLATNYIQGSVDDGTSVCNDAV